MSYGSGQKCSKELENYSFTSVETIVVKLQWKNVRKSIHAITMWLWLMSVLKGVLHLWALFLKTLYIFSKNKATSDKVSYGSGQKCSKELENYSFTSVETIVVKLQWKMCENQYFHCFET